MMTQMDIISRSAWGARPATKTSKLHSFDHGWFIHWLGGPYSAQMTDEQVLQSVQRYHQTTKGWRDIAYSFAVGRSGRVFELRGWGTAGGHTSGSEGGKSRNFNSMAIVFLIGEGETATPEMLVAASQLMAEGETRGYSADKVRPHNEVVSTACPGSQLTAWAQAYEHKEITSMDKTTATAIVKETYTAILEREADAEGLAYWVDRIVGGLPISEIRWAFMFVRLAAISAELAAVKAKLDSRNDLGLGTGASAAQVVDQFYADLAALRAS